MGNVKDWFYDFLGKKTSITIDPKMLEWMITAQELSYYKYAQSIVAERYGALLSQCDFKTYVNGKVVEKDVWYRLNVEPNPNQSSCEFMKQLANRLVFNGEALIIKTDSGDLFVAKDFQKGEYQLLETNFQNVSVDVYDDGSSQSYQLLGTFSGDKAIYIKYQNAKALAFINQLNSLYTNLIENVKSSGANGIKYSLEVDATAFNGTNIDYMKEMQKIVNQDFEALCSDKNAIIPLLSGFKLNVLNPSNANSQNATTASNNISNMIDDIKVNVGAIYNIPKTIMLGTYEKSEFDDMLTFGLDPLCSLIGECVNRKYYGKKQILEKTYCRLDTKKVKHFDILTISDSINKLISSGVYTINEVRTLLDEPLIDPEIGDKHWVTRNYAVIGDYLQEQGNYTANDKKTQQAQQQALDELIKVAMNKALGDYEGVLSKLGGQNEK